MTHTRKLTPMHWLTMGLAALSRGVRADGPTVNCSVCNPPPTVPMLENATADAFFYSLTAGNGTSLPEPVVAQALTLVPPSHRVRAPQLPNGTLAEGTAMSTFRIPLEVVGQEAPMPVIFDTGSPYVALAGEGVEIHEANWTGGPTNDLVLMEGPFLENLPGLQETNVSHTVTYGSGSWNGTYVIGDVSLAGLPVVPNLRMGRIESGADFFNIDASEDDNPQETQTRGILGVGTYPDAARNETFILSMRQQQPDFSFSFAPCHDDANVLWSAPPPELLAGPMAYAETRGTQAYTTDLKYVEIGGTRIAISQAYPARMMFDTGTSAMVFSQSVAQAIAGQLALQTNHPFWTLAASGTRPACIPLPRNVTFAQMDAALPKVTLAVAASGASDAGKVHRLTLSASQYLMVSKRHDGTNLLCPWIGGWSSISIFGVNAMAGHVLHFDDANSRVGIANGRDTCV